MTVITAETLNDAPDAHLHAARPHAKSITMTKVSSTTWKATVHLYSYGAGNVTFKRAIAHDSKHGYNSHEPGDHRPLTRR